MTKGLSCWTNTDPWLSNVLRQKILVEEDPTFPFWLGFLSLLHITSIPYNAALLFPAAVMPAISLDLSVDKK